MTTRLVMFSVAVAATVLAWAQPAAADPARPTDYRSVISGVTPESDVVTLGIVGGDAFLEIRVERGHTVEILGYQSEPYLRVRADGTVEENRRSEAVYLNENRYADVEVPDEADPEASPRWERVGSGGQYAWHDHRVHWMSPVFPAGVGRGEVVQRWQVPIVIDGDPATISGVLRLAHATPLWPWPLVGLTAGAALWLLARRRTLVATAAAAVACGLAVAVSTIEQRAIPPAAGQTWAPVAVTAIGATAALIGLAVRRYTGFVLALLGAVIPFTWAALRLRVFTKPVLPTSLPPNYDRAGTAIAAGLGLAAAIVLMDQPPRRNRTRSSP